MSTPFRSRVRQRKVQPWKQRPLSIYRARFLTEELVGVMEATESTLGGFLGALERYGRLVEIHMLERQFGDIDAAARLHIEGHEVAA